MGKETADDELRLSWRVRADGFALQPVCQTWVDFLTSELAGKERLLSLDS